MMEDADLWSTANATYRFCSRLLQKQKQTETWIGLFSIVNRSKEINLTLFAGILCMPLYLVLQVNISNMSAYSIVSADVHLSVPVACNQSAKIKQFIYIKKYNIYPA